MKLLDSIKSLCEFLGGSQDEPPPWIPSRCLPWLLGIWWALLVFGIILFCGQTSKFIYIDF